MAGELLASDETSVPSDDTTSESFRQTFELRMREWREERDAAAAEELVAAAIVTGNIEDKDVAIAAQLLISDELALPGSKEIAESILGVKRLENSQPHSTDTRRMYMEIARRKRLFRLYPRDALLLTETALLYTNLGMNGPAEELLRQATAISPDNRYVLRSLTRFWVHKNKPDRAIQILIKSPATKADPWLMAAQMAAEDVAMQEPRLWKEARRILSSDRYSGFQQAELAAAMATLHMSAGSHKLARKLFRQSLEAPTENVVAQAQWASRRDSAIDPSVVHLPDAFEALTSENLSAGRWDDAVSAARKWQELEPFSARPATTGSFISVSYKGDGLTAEAFARQGLIANSGSSTLHNNLAVALAIQGRVAEAITELENVKNLSHWSDKAVHFATQGLIQMRRGNILEGGNLYRKSMQLAIEHSALQLWCRAAAHLALEVARFDKTQLPEMSAAVANVFDKLPVKAQQEASDVTALLMRAKETVSASDMLEKLADFRSAFLLPSGIDPQSST